MNRRRFSTLLAAGPLAPAAADRYATSTAPGTAPDYEKPLFDLHKHSKAPVKAVSIELLRSGSTYFVVARSADGVTGAVKTKQVEDYYPILVNKVIPFFTGQDIRDLETLVDRIYVANYKMAGQAFWCPVAYVEQALLDLYGRTVNKPVGELLGGVKRKKIPVYLSGSGRETTAEREVAVYEKALAMTNARAVKFKIGGRMSRNADAYPGRTEKMLTLARKTYGGACVIYTDANGSYNAAKGIEIGRMLEELNCAFYEEPCPWEEFTETKRVADALKIPVAFGEQDSSFWKFQWMIENRALDIVQPDINYNGGFIRTARVARMAAHAGLTIVPHNTQTGASAVNIAQFASAIPNIGPHMEFPFRGRDENERWFAPHFKIVDGAMEVPPGPGLGIEIDPAYLAKAKKVTV
jgi:L-alanine-DL-glutamate epimerase-like enolase superfamily enzyme